MVERNIRGGANCVLRVLGIGVAPMQDRFGLTHGVLRVAKRKYSSRKEF